MIPDDAARERNCYLTTTGRVSGKAHEIEIWFAVEGDMVYMLAGGRDRSDWVKNIRSNGEARIRIGSTTWTGTGRIVDPDDALDRRMREVVATKYGERDGGELSQWARESLPVAIEISGTAS